MIEHWSTRRRARYFYAPPARSHGAFWVGDTAAAGKSRHPICSASSLKDDSNLPNRTGDTLEHQASDSNQGEIRRKLSRDSCLRPERQPGSDWPCPTCSKTDRFVSDVGKHEELKRHTLSKLSPTSVRSGRNRGGFCQTFANSASNLKRGLDCVIRSSRQSDGPGQSIVTRMTKVHAEL